MHEKITDSYRLYLSLLYGEKPVVTGAFTIAGFEAARRPFLTSATRPHPWAPRRP